jgi:hypothetical protein
MLKFIGTLFLVIGITCTAPTLPYICDWYRVQEGPTPCTDCYTANYCYMYYWDKPQCLLSLAGDCFIRTGTVAATRTTHWCVFYAGGNCDCWLDSAISETGWWLDNREVCFMSQ